MFDSLSLTSKGRNNYIPFRLTDLRESIIRDFPDAFRSEETKIKWRKLLTWFSLRNQVRIALVLNEIWDTYGNMDPDTDDIVPPWKVLSNDDMEAQRLKFFRLFDFVLAKGELDLITDEMIQDALKEQSSDGFMGTGLQVTPVDTDVIDFKCWYRGLEASLLIGELIDSE